MKKIYLGWVFLMFFSLLAKAEMPVDPSQYAPCLTPLACSAGPGGGRSIGPGGGMSIGPGGGLSFDGQYRGPWTPCLTGVLGLQWNQEHCPNYRR